MPRSSRAPPPSSSALMRCAGSSGSCCVWSAMSERTSPSVPSAMISRTRTMCGRYLVHMASSASSPRAAARSAISCASAGVQRERLLDEHVLAGVEHEPRVPRRGTDAASRRTPRRPRGRRRAPRSSRGRSGCRTRRRRRRRGLRAGADRLHGEAVQLQVVREGVGDSARREDAPAQSIGHGASLLPPRRPPQFWDAAQSSTSGLGCGHDGFIHPERPRHRRRDHHRPLFDSCGDRRFGSPRRPTPPLPRSRSMWRSATRSPRARAVVTTSTPACAARPDTRRCSMRSRR